MSLAHAMTASLLLAASACSENASETALPATSPTLDLATGDRPRAIEAGDLDGDGTLDLAIANADSDSVTIYLARSGRYVRSDHGAGNEPSDLELVDLDADGDLDIVVANHETSGVTVLRGDGEGGFAPAPGSPFDLEAEPHLHGLATGDFTGNGHVDIAADSSDADAVALLPGGPDGFGRARSIPAGEFPYYRIDELPADGDGRTAILIPSPRAGTVRLLRLDDGDRLGPAAASPGAMMVVAANLDGAGGPDVAAVGENAVRLYRAQGDGFVPIAERAFDNPVEIAVGDIDGDGLDEIAVSTWEGEDVTLLNADGGVRGTVPACRRPAALLLSDLDADGRAELVVGCWFEPVAKIVDDLP